MHNFTTSWSDGLAFNALLHHFRGHLFDFGHVARKHPNARLEHAFRLAQEHLGIERLLDPEGKYFSFFSIPFTLTLKLPAYSADVKYQADLLGSYSKLFYSIFFKIKRKMLKIFRK